MKKSLALLLLLGIIPCRVAANEPSETFNLTTGQPVSGTAWSFDANHHYFCQGDATNGHGDCPASPRKDVPTLFVNDGANLRLTGSSTTIRVQVSGNAQITLDNASIVRTGHSVLRNEPKDGQPKHYITISPMQLVGNANLTLTLVGDNTLAMGDGTSSLDRWSAGLGVPDGTTLTIGGNGKLTAIGGISAAGIGGHQGGVPGTHFGRPAGNITINSGTIIATGRELASGIGNGSNMQGGTITINGGDITARGGSTRVALGLNGGAAGIGSGGSANAVAGNPSRPYSDWCKPSVININGGVVRAFGGGGSAGIGGASGGLNDNAVNITINITGGEITATGGNDIMAGGAGIGGGKYVGGGNINISGGTVNAIGGCFERSGSANPADGFGAGIGAGGGTASGTTNNFTLNGNAVVFVSGLTNYVAPAQPNNSTNTTTTRGILFNGNTGAFHGTSVEPTNNFTIQSGRTLTVPFGRTLTINEGITLTNNGTVINNGTVVICGEITGWNGFWQGNPPDNCQPTSISGVRRADNRFGIMFAENPVSDNVEIVVNSEFGIRNSELKIAIYDMVGNVVFNSEFRIPTTQGLGAERPHSELPIVWDLRNTAGRIVANGTYLVIAEVKDQNGRTHTYSARLGVKR